MSHDSQRPAASHHAYTIQHNRWSRRAVATPFATPCCRRHAANARTRPQAVLLYDRVAMYHLVNSFLLLIFITLSQLTTWAIPPEDVSLGAERAAPSEGAHNGASEWMALMTAPLMARALMGTDDARCPRWRR